jgi:PAS domain S-box-containing protein
MHTKDLILIVDDQPASLKILLSFLQHQDFDLRILQSGSQALRFLQHFSPNIILLDILMPDMDGLETCRQIKEHKAWAEIPIIFMTALNSVADKIAGFEAGGVDYITKPFQQAEVLARVNTQLNLRRKTLKLQKTQSILERQKTMLESLLHSIPDPIYFKDMDNRYLGCNWAFEAFVGKKSPDILGKNDAELFSDSPVSCFQGLDQEMLESGTTKRLEESLVCPDGREQCFDMLKTPYIGLDGKPLGLIGIYRNISDLKKAELQAAEERERLSVTLHSIGDAVITTDVTGKVLSINKVAEQLTGWTNAEAKGKASVEVFTILHEKTGEALPDPIQQVLEQENMVQLDKHTLLLRKDGSRLNIADSCAPIRDRKGSIIGVVIVFRDITQEKKMIDELIKVKKLESLGLLAAGIAHDFNNILMAILGNIELAVSEIAEPSNALLLLEDALKATERASKLTQQLLTFAKGGEPVKEQLSLVHIVRDSVKFILRGSAVLCSCSFAEDVAPVYADSSQLSQVIQNIVLNAKYAMPYGGTIRLNCFNVEGRDLAELLPPERQEERFVCICIADSGTGIAPDILDKIFDPFFTTKTDGNGLGLAICHSVVKKHEGFISVQSELGQGSTFSIYLPALEAAETSNRAFHIPEKSQQHAQGLKIMVMDDEPMLRDLAKAQLQSLGHEAVLVANGEEALGLYRQLHAAGKTLDMVIMDLTIPGGMGGQEAAALLLDFHPEARLIVASGYSNDPVLAEYKKYGFRAAIAKPFNLKELQKALTSAL